MATMAGLRVLFRYQKANRMRAYGVRAIDDRTTELWVVSEERGRVTKSRRLVTLNADDDAAAFLDSIEQELRRGGWSATQTGVGAVVRRPELQFRRSRT